MLVLSRKVGEKIQIGHGITLTLVRIGRGNAHLGIDAPKDVPVYRDEIKKRIDAETSAPEVRENRQ